MLCSYTLEFNVLALSKLHHLLISPSQNRRSHSDSNNKNRTSQDANHITEESVPRSEADNTSCKSIHSLVDHCVNSQLELLLWDNENFAIISQKPGGMIPTFIRIGCRIEYCTSHSFCCCERYTCKGNFQRDIKDLGVCKKKGGYNPFVMVWVLWRL